MGPTKWGEMLALHCFSRKTGPSDQPFDPPGSPLLWRGAPIWGIDRRNLPSFLKASR